MKGKTIKRFSLQLCKREIWSKQCSTSTKVPHVLFGVVFVPLPKLPHARWGDSWFCGTCISFAFYSFKNFSEHVCLGYLFLYTIYYTCFVFWIRQVKHTIEHAFVHEIQFHNRRGQILLLYEYSLRALKEIFSKAE